MKKFILSTLNYVYLQMYVTFAILFFSKEKLVRIASAGGNHPMVVFGTARWARIWWFSLIGLVVWFFALSPYLNLILFVDPITWFSEITHSDEVIYFGKWSINIYVLIIVGVFSGKLLQVLEIWSANKMEHFRNHLRAELPMNHFDESALYE